MPKDYSLFASVFAQLAGLGGVPLSTSTPPPTEVLALPAEEPTATAEP